MATEPIRVREIIDGQRDTMREELRYSTPIIVQSLLRKTDRLMADHRAPMLTVLGTGRDHLVRQALHRPSELPSSEQLDLWPEELRQHVARIGHRAVMVPSRGRMVPLLPGVISKAEVREAAAYLRQKGRETLRRADACDRLADRMT